MESQEFVIDESKYISTWKSIASDILEDSGTKKSHYVFSEKVRSGEIDILTKEGFDSIPEHQKCLAEWAVNELRRYPYTFKPENFWFTQK